MSIWTSILKKKTGRKVRAPRRWDRREEEFLKEWYGKKPVSWLAKKLRRSKASITVRANKLGLKSVTTWRLWQPEDDAYLRTSYGKKPIAEMATELQRSPASIRVQANKIGLHIYNQFGRR